MDFNIGIGFYLDGYSDFIRFLVQNLIFSLVLSRLNDYWD